MIEINKTRLLVLEKDGNWVVYPKKVGSLHIDDLLSYCKGLGIPISTPKEVVRSTDSIIFYNLNNSSLLAYLPKQTISNEQLYELELFTQLSLDGVNYMEVQKVGKKITEEFVLKDDVVSKFSNKIIQSYYHNSKHL